MKMSLSLFLLILLASCSWSLKPKQLTIVVLVESLSQGNTPCRSQKDSELKGGWGVVCSDFQELTHVYTPNTMSLPVMASVFTGRSSDQHRVVHNGASKLDEKFTTLAEMALKQKFKTLFISGGPPLIAKSGMEQGFELFVDHVKMDLGYKPAVQIFKDLLSAVRRDNGSKFFAMTYLADLQFPIHQSSKKELMRLSQAINQMSVIDTAMEQLFTALKKRGLWEKTNIVIMGLNGDRTRKPHFISKHESVFSENTHVPVYIKLNAGFSQKNTPVLNRLFSTTHMHYLVKSMLFGSKSLEESLGAFNVAQVQTRSYWRNWRFGEAISRSLRTRKNLFFMGQEKQFYETEEDRDEESPLALDEKTLAEFSFVKFEEPLFTEESTHYRKSFDYSFVLKALTNAYYQGQQVNPLSWRDSSLLTKRMQLDEHLSEKNWLALGTYKVKGDIASYAAALALNESVDTDKGGCLRLLSSEKRSAEKCKDHLLVTAHQLKWCDNKKNRKFFERAFVRGYQQLMTYKKLSYLNLKNAFAWDLPMDQGIGPSMAEYYVNLPEQDDLRRILKSYNVPLTYSWSSFEETL